MSKTTLFIALQRFPNHVVDRLPRKPPPTEKTGEAGTQLIEGLFAAGSACPGNKTGRKIPRGLFLVGAREFLAEDFIGDRASNAEEEEFASEEWSRRRPERPGVPDVQPRKFAIIEEPGLSVPHPRFRERRFVLEPLAAIAPGLRDPVTGLTVRELLQRLSRT